MAIGTQTFTERWARVIPEIQQRVSPLNWTTYGPQLRWTALDAEGTAHLRTDWPYEARNLNNYWGDALVRAFQAAGEPVTRIRVYAAPR